jgi:hypothetical protein
MEVMLKGYSHKQYMIIKENSLLLIVRAKKQ